MDHDLLPPLSNQVGFKSTKLGEFSKYLSGSYCDHRVFKRGSAGIVDARHHRAPLVNLSLNYLQYRAEVEIDPVQLDSFFMLKIPLSGWTQLENWGRSVRNEVGMATIVSPTKTVRSLWFEDCGQRMLKISRAAVERRVVRMLERSMGEALVFEPLINLARPIISSRYW